MPNTNLSPELLTRLQQLQAMGGNSGWVPQFGFSDAGQDYTPMFDTSGKSGMDASTPSLFGYASNRTGAQPGETGQLFGTDGGYTGDFTVKSDRALQMLAMAIAAAGGMAAFAPGGFLAGNAGAGAGAANGMWDVLPDAVGAQTTAMGAGPAASAAVPSTFNAAVDSQAANAAIDAAGGNALANYAGPVTAATAVNGGGASSSLFGQGVTSLLGPAATLIGALTGSQGSENNQTQERRMDPRFDPYYFGDNGLLPMTMQQLQRSMSPEVLAGFDQMRNTGQSLFSQPVAGNGFSRFFPGR